MAITYRLGRPGDAERLGQIHTRSWQVGYAGLLPADRLAALDPVARSDGFRPGLELGETFERGITWVVAEVDGVVVAHAASQFFDGDATLRMLYVDPDHWGRGIGRGLHDIALRGLRRQGCERALLRVLEGNERAIAMYRRLGWEFTGESYAEEMLDIELVDLEMARDLGTPLLEANRGYWNAQADEYATWAPRAWDRELPSIGIFGVDAQEIFPNVEGLDVVELGCGTGYISGWCLKRGAASAVGLDNSARQLATAQRMAGDRDAPLRLVFGDAHHTPFANDSFDVAINEYGAAIWCDPRIWIREAARILRPGGRLWFLANSVQMVLCMPEFEGELAEARLRRSQRDMHRFEWIDTDGVEFHVGHGEMISILSGAGFVIDALHELYTDADAQASGGDFVDGGWASRWPVEDVWVAHLRDPG